MNEYVFELKDVSIAAGSDTLQINNSDSVFGAIPSSMLWIDSYRPRFVQSVDNTARTVTLTANWDGADVINKPATIAPFPSLGQQQNAVDAVNSVKSSAQTLLDRFLSLESTYRDYLADRFFTLASLIENNLHYQTYQEMIAAPNPSVSNVMAFVWNDPIVANNGLYGFDGSNWEWSVFNPAVKDDIENLGIEYQSQNASGLAFAIVDENGLRTWLESDIKGKPTSHAIEKIKLVSDFYTGSEVFDFFESEGWENIDSSLESIAYSVVDENGLRTWIESDLSGNPTTNSIDKIKQTGEFLDSSEIIENISSQTGSESFNSSISGVAFALVDESGRRTWLEADLNGDPTSQSVNRMAAALGLANKWESGPNFVAWGDSLTAGTGGNGTPYTQHLQSLLNSVGSSASVTNRGVGGEDSVTITARTNANPFLCEVDNAQIPATGRVNITLMPINGVIPAPLKQGPSSYAATLNGVAGVFGRTITNSIYQYWFERDTDGDAVECIGEYPLYLTSSYAHQEDIAIIWMGQNGPTNARTVNDARAVAAYLSPPQSRYLVLSKPGGNSYQDADDAVFFAEFGRRFIPVRQLLSRYGLQWAGLTATQADLDDMATGAVPASLRYDAIHLNTPGYQCVAKIIFERLTELGWL
ncbi:hypothetical protein SAMN05216361_0053 [Marisediminitalea aggregata]|uniref:Uncharacterized protein n=1 Tax=Marisediminitalea aggregata TaxID=634436 RepID=A0A1M5SP89_9ALTE|nr:hypothetical protein [Marisediminitalea aggregata]SHH40306.1 hypothetical protein SAMN05216361_0053 [Marisediminitalea aggregata]